MMKEPKSGVFQISWSPDHSLANWWYVVCYDGSRVHYVRQDGFLYQDCDTRTRQGFFATREEAEEAYALALLIGLKEHQLYREVDPKLK